MRLWILKQVQDDKIRLSSFLKCLEFLDNSNFGQKFIKKGRNFSAFKKNAKSAKKVLKYAKILTFLISNCYY